MSPRHFPPVFWIALTIGLLPCCADAQWAWRDAQGRITFSDTPPPADIPANQIVRKPNAAPTDVAPPVTDSGNPGDTQEKPATAAPGPKPRTLSEKDEDFRKRRDERLKAEQQATEDAARAAQRREACDQARGYLDMVNSGMRVMRANPDGTRGFLDDDQRAAEVSKAEETISKNCSGE